MAFYCNRYSDDDSQASVYLFSDDEGIIGRLRLEAAGENTNVAWGGVAGASRERLVRWFNEMLIPLLERQEQIMCLPTGSLTTHLPKVS